MSSMPPRPKPWETAQNGNANSSAVTNNATAGPSNSSSAFDNALAASTNASSSSAPRIPDRPAGLEGTLASNGIGSGMSPYQSRYGTGYGGYGGSYGGMGGYGGMSSYGGMGGYGSYTSPLNRMGGYGGYAGGYGIGGYGVGGMGAPGENPNLASSLQASTAPAFAVIESLVMAFSSVAQLIESTYMATHSSFFAMVGVADQLGSVKTYLGQVLGVFSLLRLGRRILNWLKGKKTQVSTEGWANEWSSGISGQPVGPAGNHGRPSAKPLLLFLLSAVGLPYLMTRLVKLLVSAQQKQQAAEIENLDPSKLTFARAVWEFRAGEEWELNLGRDEIVAVLEMREGKGDGDKGWWRGRTRDGRIGWFPGNYVEIIQRRAQINGPPA